MLNEIYWYKDIIKKISFSSSFKQWIGYIVIIMPDL